MLRNPGKTFSIYEVAGCVKEAHMKVMTPGNICAAFKATGIFPFDRDIFTDLDFAPSEVTNRQINIENEQNEINVPVQNNESRTSSPSILELSCPASPQVFLPASLDIGSDGTMISSASELQPPRTPPKSPGTTISASCTKELGQSSFSSNVKKGFLSPFQLRGLPKAGPRKSGRTPRRKRKSIIATDTPNKNEIQLRQEKKQIKRKIMAKTKKRKVLQSSSSEDDHISVYSEEEATDEDEENEHAVVDIDCLPALQNLPKEGDFIIVKFEVKGKLIYYIAKVIGESENETEVSFLRRSNKIPNNFHMPNVPDIATVALNDIKMILPKPKCSGNNKRKQCLYNFALDFSKFDLR